MGWSGLVSDCKHRSTLLNTGNLFEDNAAQFHCSKVFVVNWVNWGERERADVAADFRFQRFHRFHLICLSNVKKLSDNMSQFVFKGKIPNTKSFSLKLSPLLKYCIYTPFVDKQDQYFGEQIKFSVKSMSLQSEHIFLLIFPLKRWIEPLLIFFRIQQLAQHLSM